MAPRTLQPSGLALVIIPSVASTLIVLVRVCKKVVERRFAIEDGLLIFAQMLIFVLMFTTWRGFRASWYGYHYYDIPEDAIDPVVVLKWNYTNAVIYNPILGLIKASFVITLIKLRSPNKYINQCLYGIFAINAAFTVAAPLVCAFQCIPVAKFWERERPGKCLDGPSYAYGTIGVVLITDVMVVMMPTWILYNLQMPLKRKLVLISFLSFGVAVTAIGAYRLYVFWYLYNGFAENPDAKYSVRQGLSNLEVSLASIGACGGTVKWLLGRCMPFFASEDTRVSKAKRSDPSNLSRDRPKNFANPNDITCDDEVELRNQDDVDGAPGWRKSVAQTRVRTRDWQEESDLDAKSDSQSFGATKSPDWDAASKGSTTPGKDVSVYERRQKPAAVI